jgi:hypothetical protein
MRSFDVPLTDQNVSANSDGVKDMGKIAGGFAILTVAGSIGVYLGQRLMSTGASTLGVDNPNGGDSGVSLEV